MKRQLSPAQLAHNRAIARKGGLARAKAFTSDYQRRALYRRNELYGDWWLKEWGTRGYVALMRQSGFDTVFMDHMTRRGY